MSTVLILMKRALTFEPLRQGNLLDSSRQHFDPLLDNFFTSWPQLPLAILFVKHVRQAIGLLGLCYRNVHTILKEGVRKLETLILCINWDFRGDVLL